MNRLAAALVLLITACDMTPAVPSDEGIPLELARLRAETISEPRYAFSLDVPDAVDEAIRGHLRLTFSWDDPEGHPVVLDFLRPGERVESVRVNGREAEWRPVHDHVVMAPGSFETDDENTVEIEFVAGDEALNRSDDFLYTLFVPDRAHFSLPVFDQPNLKARLTLELNLPGGWTAVANGPASEQSVKDDRTTVSFVESDPIPTYLFAFAAGAFEVEVAERAGRTMRMLHRETDRAKVERNRDAVFDLHERALAWLEEYTDIPYPFLKFDFALIPSFQYGGMEHPGAIFYRAASLFLDESATQGQLLGRASVIAHETAHMWFGDLVTMDWFDDVWMKEVFAGFMAAKVVHPSFPEVDHDLRFFLAHHPAAYAVDRSGGANPIRQPLENLNQAGTLYGAIIYQKAPIVMKQLEMLVGEDAFRDGLREYLSKFAFGNATWPDLIEILDGRSPEDLEAWSRVWVSEPGRPSISAFLTPDPEGRIGQLTVIQEDVTGGDRVWPQHFTLVAGWGDSIETRPVALLGAAEAIGVWEGKRPPDFILPDGDGVGYGHFHLDDRTRAYLLESLPGIEDPRRRGVAWVTLWDAVLEGEVGVPPFTELLIRGLETETVEQNVQRILSYLSTTYWRLTTDEQRRRLAPRMERVLWDSMRWAATPTLRSAVFSTYRDVALTPEALGRLVRIWREEERVPGVTLAERDFTALAFGLAIREVDGWEGILDGQLDRIDNPDRKSRFEFVRPSVSADPTERGAFFESLRDPSNRGREPWVLAGLTNLHHPLRAPGAQRFIQPSLEMLEEIQRTGDIFLPGRWLDATLGGHNTPAAAETVRAFVGARPDYPARLRGKILQSADMLERAASIVHGGG